MKVVSAEFIRSCYDAGQLPGDRMPEVAFAGRSNVGKSSLINSLLYRKKLAKVSQTPGKTRALNFFRVSILDRGQSNFYVVDLPGYGYAKVAKSVRAEWGPMIEGYLRGRAALRGVVLLIDARGVQGQDQLTLEWLRAIDTRVVVVSTKVDKLSRTARATSLAGAGTSLGLPPDASVLPYSSVTHEGREALWRVLRDVLATDG